MQNINENRNFANNIIWTDECNFSMCGMFNRRNEHYWSVDNPRQNRQIRKQGRVSVNVWVGMWNDNLIGPYMYDGNLTSQRYFNFLQNDNFYMVCINKI